MKFAGCWNGRAFLKRRRIQLVMSNFRLQRTHNNFLLTATTDPKAAG